MAKRGKIDKPVLAESEVRPERLKKYKYLFLIVCEDQKTEPSYFEYFKVQIPEESIYLRSVGVGRDPKGVVLSAIDERNKLAFESKREVDKVWVVFDKDDADENQTKVKNFEDAFTIAADEKFEIAYSNEVFELWLLLHFTKVNKNVALPRKAVYKMLQEQIRKTKKYESYVYVHAHPQKKTIDIVFEIGNVDLAISRAELLLENQKGKNPIEANPSTTVHFLVQQLREWINYYSYTK
ncbi:RloB family protein [Flavobacterium sp.]|uniref:RloB family protein n=1 Tax=Flavobacterium sp. TaxID=239 RepID=UPI002FD913AB